MVGRLKLLAKTESAALGTRLALPGLSPPATHTEGTAGLRAVNRTKLFPLHNEVSMKSCKGKIIIIIGRKVVFITRTSLTSGFQKNNKIVLCKFTPKFALFMV